MVTKRVTRVRPIFRWFDLWVGARVDTQVPAIYICPLPTIGIKIWRETIGCCHWCGHEAKKVAYNDTEGWVLGWECINRDCNFYGDEIEAIEWPFGSRSLNGAEMREHGYEVI